MRGAVDLTVCYCSVFDECWTSNLQDAMEGFRGNPVMLRFTVELLTLRGLRRRGARAPVPVAVSPGPGRQPWLSCSPSS